MANDAPTLGTLTLDQATLAPLLRQIVTETICALEANRAAIGQQEVFTEAEAAAWLRLADYQLRDERRRGRIAGTKIVGGKVRYTRADLLAYLARNRLESGSD